MTLVDTNVLLDVHTDDPQWAEWSIGQVEAAALRGPVGINDIIFAELAVRFREIEAIETFLASAGIVMVSIPRSALFVAAKVFTSYRRAGGLRTGVLPDFFIGAHAATLGWRLLSRDRRRYRTYFPDVDLITP